MIGILETIYSESDDIEVENAFESVLDFAMEATAKKNQIIDAKTRDALPDNAFGVVYTNADGEKQRKYPLIVKSDDKATRELIGRAIEYFHFCKPDWKPQLAKNIIKAINTTGVNIKIHPKNQINKYVTVPPKYISNDTNNKFQDKEH